MLERFLLVCLRGSKFSLIFSLKRQVFHGIGREHLTLRSVENP